MLDATLCLLLCVALYVLHLCAVLLMHDGVCLMEGGGMQTQVYVLWHSLHTIMSTRVGEKMPLVPPIVMQVRAHAHY